MQRREFVTVFGALAATWPLSAGAQQQAMPVVGFLHSASLAGVEDLVAAFRRGLNEAGYVEQRNVSIEYRFAEGQYSRLPELAADLVRRGVAVIAATGGDPLPLAAMAATAKIPIVFNSATDPVKLGLVASLNRPGGNLTGVSQMTSALAPKRLEFLRELVPATTVAVLVNPNNPSTEPQLLNLHDAARKLALRLDILRASTEREIDAAFATFAQQRSGALLIAGDPLFFTRREQIVSLVAGHSVPAMYARREFASAGGLMSYDASLADVYRLVGGYTGRVLKGEKPADLPVQLSARVELIINMKTAKALGITFPLTLLGRADEVIE